jgi:hypothetical protein
MAVIDIYGEQSATVGGEIAFLDVTDVSATPEVLRQFPFGEYWNRTVGWLPAVARAFARFFSRLRRAREILARQYDPRTADVLLPDREAERGVVPLDGQTLEERRAVVLAKMRAEGGVNAAYYTQVCVDAGYLDAVVTSAADPFTTISTADDFLAGATRPDQQPAAGGLLCDLHVHSVIASWEYSKLAGSCADMAASVRHVDFKLTDDKQRKIGALITIGKDGEGWAARITATRDGQPFGAITKPIRSTDWEALASAITKRVARMGKRYAKIAAGHRGSHRDKLSGASVTIEVADDRPRMYQVICDDHATLVGADTMRDAKRTSTLDFCDECRDKIARVDVHGGKMPGCE